jgi:predicted house-cleaning noncanonical NTP pyrophosphatase (MazG superfamily)
VITEYNKLVRDDIREIITSSGATAITRILSELEIIPELLKKLREETGELLCAIGDDRIYEYADIQEVINALTLESGYTIAMREQRRVELFEIFHNVVPSSLRAASSRFASPQVESDILSDLAEMQQALNGFILSDGFTLAQVDRARFEKLRDRGGFEDRVFLISTEVQVDK